MNKSNQTLSGQNGASETSRAPLDERLEGVVRHEEVVRSSAASLYGLVSRMIAEAQPAVAQQPPVELAQTAAGQIGTQAVVGEGMLADARNLVAKAYTNA